MLYRRRHFHHWIGWFIVARLLHALGVGRLFINLFGALCLGALAVLMAGPAWAFGVTTALALTAIVVWAAE